MHTAKRPGADDAEEVVVPDPICSLLKAEILLRNVREDRLRCFPDNLAQSYLVVSLPPLLLRLGQFCLGTFHGLSDPFMPGLSALNHSLELAIGHRMCGTGEEHGICAGRQNRTMHRLGGIWVTIRAAWTATHDDGYDSGHRAVARQLLASLEDSICTLQSLGQIGQHDASPEATQVNVHQVASAQGRKVEHVRQRPGSSVRIDAAIIDEHEAAHSLTFPSQSSNLALKGQLGSSSCMMVMMMICGGAMRRSRICEGAGGRLAARVMISGNSRADVNMMVRRAEGIPLQARAAQAHWHIHGDRNIIVGIVFFRRKCLVYAWEPLIFRASQLAP
mmetsp:Transcript_31591/g.56703  ORF Transcript_31591/g.56703 Transcript_31591/m.56703 type:complete len:333 (-) Transcript_31591:268-1266(-)